MIELKLFGVGLVLQFLYDYFYASRNILFAASIVSLYFKIKLPLLIFVLYEVIIYWSQYYGPIIDVESMDKIRKFLEDGEIKRNDVKNENNISTDVLNIMIKKAWRSIYPDSSESVYCKKAQSFFISSFPCIMKDINVPHIFFGSEGPYFNYVELEQNKNGRLICNVDGVFADNAYVIIEYTVLGIPFQVSIMNPVFYSSMKIFIQSPEPDFTKLPPILAIAWTSNNKVTMLSCTIHINGFNITSLPFISYLCYRFCENCMNRCLSNGKCVFWDWLTGETTVRQMNKAQSERSQKIFGGIAEMVQHDDEYDIFIPKAETIKNLQGSRELLLERIHAKELPPNKRIIYMSTYFSDYTCPYYEVDIDELESCSCCPMKRRDHIVKEDKETLTDIYGDK